jgi:MFS transporter, DHA3 family, macrolide efflux protein
MRLLLLNRGLRLIFIANLVSMIGSGMNTAAVTWFILQATHSEMSLSTLVVLQTVPALLMLPFTGVIIDREDRRHLVMLLDALRGAVILAVAVLAFRNQVQIWHLYAMGALVAAGFWMFWPTITALIQELAPESEFVGANTMLLAGVQGGWMIAGAIVGFMYERIHLGGVLALDAATYAISLMCYFAVRRGKVTVKPREVPAHVAGDVWAKYVHELSEGIHYLRGKSHIVLLGISWAIFIASMLTQGVTTAPLSDRILHAGARGYGWLNAGWAIGAFTSALYASLLIRRLNGRRSVVCAMAMLAISLTLVPWSASLAIAVMCYAVMGTGRGLAGVGISSTMMEMVPKHFMGRVQNTFFFIGTSLQLVASIVVGAIAEHISLALAFAIIGVMYGVAAITAAWPVTMPDSESACAALPVSRIMGSKGQNS